MKTNNTDEFCGYHFYEWEAGDKFNTFGGEYHYDDLNINEYGMQCDGFSVSGIPSSDFKNLAVEMINHLMRNGHDFEFLNDGYNGNYFGVKNEN